MTPVNAQLAAVATMRQHARPDQSVPTWLLTQLAAAHGCTTRTVRRWWAQEQTDEPAARISSSVAAESAASHYADAPRRGWTLTREHLDVVRCHTLRDAWEHLRAADRATPSYQTFTSHVRRLDSGLLGALHNGGHAGLVQSRLYLGGPELRRNQRWLMDSEEIPVHVVPPRGYKPIKLWQVTAIDDATRIVMATVITPTQPNADDVAACIGAGIAGRTYDTGAGAPVYVGGIPDEIVWDNGAEFLNGTISSLGTLGRATAPYAPWAKGRIESWHRTVQSECYSTQPGYTHGPKNHSGQQYFNRDARAQLSVDMLISRALAWNDFYCSERPHTQLDGRTPLEAWAADAGALRVASREQLWEAMYLVEREHTVNRAGIRYDREDYVAAELNAFVGRKVTLRRLPHLPLDESYLEVFFDKAYVCRAVPVRHTTEEERADVLYERRTQAFRLRDINRNAAQLRKTRSESSAAAAFLTGNAGPLGTGAAPAPADAWQAAGTNSPAVADPTAAATGSTGNEWVLVSNPDGSIDKVNAATGEVIDSAGPAAHNDSPSNGAPDYDTKTNDTPDRDLPDQGAPGRDEAAPRKPRRSRKPKSATTPTASTPQPAEDDGMDWLR